MLKLEDVLDLVSHIEKAVVAEENGTYLRRYYRFRASKHYGGSAVADVVGCMFNCVYCWSWRINHNLRKGFMVRPLDVAKELISIARAMGYSVVRMSGGEPTIGFQHLLQVVEAFAVSRARDTLFMLETNGLLLGLKKNFVEEIENYGDIIAVRISLKGCSEEEFELITGMEGSIYTYQLKAIENVVNSGLRLRIAVPISFCNRKSFSLLLERLSHIDEDAVRILDPEVVVLYPSVARRMCPKRLRPWIAVDPIEMKEVKGDKVNEFFGKRCRETRHKDSY